MKFLPLLLANLKRKKIRTTLTVGSFVVAFFLFGRAVTFYSGTSNLHGTSGSTKPKCSPAS